MRHVFPPAIKDCQAILGLHPEPAFDEIAELAAAVCGTPMALVSFVDRDRQWFKAEFGVGARETPIEESICAHAVRHGGPLVIPDLTRDPRSRDMECVRGELCARFYAGVPTRNSAGALVGTVCVIDRVPRGHGLSKAQMTTLLALAEQVTSLICLREALSMRRSYAIC